MLGGTYTYYVRLKSTVTVLLEYINVRNGHKAILTGSWPVCLSSKSQ